MSKKLVLKKGRDTFSRRRFIQIIGVTTAGFTVPIYYLEAETDSLPIVDPDSFITDNDDFYILQIGDPREINAKHWKLSVTGLVEKPVVSSYDQICQMESVTTQRTLKCIGDPIGLDQMSNAEWIGVPLRDLVNQARIKPTAKQFVFQCADGYHARVPIERGMRKEVLLAYKMNGEDLPVEHGYPVRLLNPGHYGVKNPKWIINIMLVEKHIDYWEKQGWDPIARVKLATVIRLPNGDLPLNGGQKVTISGAAFDGGNYGGIKAVEISTDKEKSWHPADIWAKESSLTWYLWKYDWQVPSGVEQVEICARAITNDGTVQGVNGVDDEKGGAVGYHVINASVS